MSRDFLGDEVHMLQSDNAVLRNELDLVKLLSERKTEENRILRQNLSDLHSRYEAQLTDAVGIRTILEQTARSLSAGLAQFAERKQVRKEHQKDETIVVEVPPKPPQPQVPYAPRPIASDKDPPPQFLRRPAQEGEARPGTRAMRDVVDNRIPANNMPGHSDDDKLRQMHDTIQSQSIK